MSSSAIRWQRQALEIILLAGFVAVISFFVYQANSILNRQMEELKVQSIEMLENRLGRRIQYQSISPSLLGFLAIRELTVFSVEDPQAVLLRINRVKIYYNILRLLLKKDPLHAISEVQIANSSLSVNYDRDRELFEFIDKLLPIPSGADRRSSHLELPEITLSGANINLEYVHTEWAASLTNLFFTISSSPDFYELSIRSSLQYRRTGYGEQSPALSTRLKINGKVDRGFAWSDLAVKVYSLSTESLNLRRQTFQVSYNGRQLKVSKIQDRAPLDVQLSFDSEKAELNVRFKTDNFKPANLFQLSGVLQRYNNWLGSSVTATGDLTYNVEQASFSYRADVQLSPAEQLLPLDAHLSSHLHGTEKILYLEPLILQSSQGTVEFNGNVLIENFFPAGLLHLTDIRSAGSPNVNATLQVERAARSLTLRGDRLSVGDIQFAVIGLSITPQKKEVLFSLETSVSDSGRTGFLQSSGKVLLQKKPSLTLDSRISDLALNTLYRLIMPKGVSSIDIEHRLEPLSVSFTSTIQTDFMHFSLTSEDLEIYEAGNRSNYARFALGVTEDSVEVANLQARWRGYELAGQARALFSRDQAQLSSLLFFEGIPYELNGTLIPGREVRVSGSYGLRAGFFLSAQEPTTLDLQDSVTMQGQPFYLQTVNFPVPLKKGKVLFSTELDGLLARDGSLYAQSKRTLIRNIPYLPVKESSLQFSFTLQKDRLSLEKVVYQDSISTVAGSGNLVLAHLAPLSGEGWIKLEDKAGLERYSLSAGVRGDTITAQLDFRRSPLERAGELVVTGDLSGRASFNGTLIDPDVRTRILLEDGKLNVDPLGLEISVNYSKNRLSLESLNFSFLTHKLTEASGQLDLEKGDFAFGSRYISDYFGLPVLLNVDLRGHLEKPVLSLTLKDILQTNLDGTLRLASIQVDKKSYPDWLFWLQARQGTLSIDGGPKEAIHGRISQTGDFTLELLPPLPISGSARGRLERDKIDSTFSVRAADMRIINTLLQTSTDIIKFTQGTGSGDLRIAGLITDPDWFGTLEVKNAAMSFRLSPEKVAPINGKLVFDEKTFIMPRVASFAGKTRVEAEGTFSIDHWLPETFELAFYVDQYPGAHIRSTFAPVFIDGYGTGAIRVQGDAVSTRVDGKLTANNCRIALVRPETEAPPQDEALSLDLKVTVGRGVEFFWPALTFPVVHTYAKQGEQVSLSLDGETGVFSMAGDVEIRGGEIFYFDRSFYLKRGNIRFEETLGDFDPWISALAEVRERDQNNEEIRIYLEANNKLSQFSPRFYSDPARPDVEILNLIGGTILDRFDESNFGISAVMLTSDIIGQFGILSPFERAVRQILNLDLFSIRTQFLQNVLLGKLLGENIGGGALNPLDNTTLSLGKYLGTDLFLQALVRFQSVEALNSAYNISTEGELNLEWSTPFFLLEWTFTPRHPENLFLSDNSIGLSWKFSY